MRVWSIIAVYGYTRIALAGDSRNHEAELGCLRTIDAHARNSDAAAGKAQETVQATDPGAARSAAAGLDLTAPTIALWPAAAAVDLAPPGRRENENVFCIVRRRR
jgi:hypothetical protein